ncbi:MAG: hypothetical protein KDC98_14150 [Planctomycetes bacterium]|nr:hypothetical protein [Planctomycetota bacterium]
MLVRRLRIAPVLTAALTSLLPAQVPRLLGDCNPGGDSMVAHRASGPLFWDVYGGTWFGTDQPSALWHSDGSAAGTVRFINVPYAAPEHVVAALGRVFFVGNDTRGWELWSSDGTTAGTSILVDINPGPGFGYGRKVIDAAESGGQLFFAPIDPAIGQELWRTDGTPGGTVLVRDLLPGPASSAPRGFLRHGSFVFFVADSASQTELWRSDGTAAGTVAIATIDAVRFESPPTPLPGRRFGFVTLSSATHDFWVSDGTPAGTTLVRRFAIQTPVTILGSDATGAFLFEHRGGLGSACWYTDGTANGTRQLVSSVEPEPTHIAAEGIVWRDRLYFALRTPASGMELWSSDGTAAGTSMLADLNPGPDSSDPYSFTAVGDRALYFLADVGSGHRLFRTDGTAAGTMPIATRVVPAGRLVASGGMLFLTASQRGVGIEPFAFPLGANTLGIGGGCAASSWPARLAVTDPVLGRAVNAVIDEGPAKRFAVLAVGFRSPLPRIAVGSGPCVMPLDLVAPIGLMNSVTDAAGHATFAGNVPNDPRLQGVQLVAQALLGPTAQAPFGADVSPAVLLTLGR